jgi:hypothetical protein
MDGEHKARCHGPRDFQPSENQSEKEGGDRVKNEVDDMIAKRGLPPKMVFYPERRMKEGIVLLGRVNIEPDSPQAVKGL